MALAEKQKREEAERAKELKRQKPARIALGCAAWTVVLIGMPLAAGDKHALLGFGLFGVAAVGYGVAHILLFKEL
jgi:hypothetical protein